MARDVLLADPPLVKYAGSGPMTVALILTPWLKAGVTIASVGAPTVAGNDEELSVSAQSVNEETYTSRDDESSHAVGKVVTYKVTGGTSGERYTITFPLVLSNGDEPDAKVPWVII